tara:strand:- start:772 stop:1041 length:270 start_codon:yes stop_codon:yes gene_type:complete
MIKVLFEDGVHVRSEHGVSFQIGRVVGKDGLMQVFVLIVVEDFVAVVYRGEQHWKIKGSFVHRKIVHRVGQQRQLVSTASTKMVTDIVI